MRSGEVDIERLNHAAIRVVGSKVVYIDPFQIGEGSPADVVLITHEHFDHCSIEDLQKITGQDTIIVCPPDCQSKFRAGNIECAEVLLVQPGVRLALGEVHVQAVPAYNIGKAFHPKDNEWVGYVIEMDGQRIYHAGDTDDIPEMAQLKDIDVACLPVSGTYVMTAKEAAHAAAKFDPKIAIPMHYGAIIGSKADAEEFKRLWRGKTEILGP